jgi:hypothetical protein
MEQDPADNIPGAGNSPRQADEADGAAPERALAPLPARQIEIFGDEVMAVRLPDGSIWLSLRALCASFGLARAMQAQRIRRNDVLAGDLIDVRVETQGGQQTVQVLRLESVPYWVSTIQIRRVRPEIQTKLLEYKRWVVQKVYEAFIREGNELLVDEPAIPPSATIQELIRVRDWARAMMNMAEAHIELERRQQHLEQRIDKSAMVFQDLRKRVSRLEQRLDPAYLITDEQQAAVQQAVKGLALLMTGRDGQNHFQGVWGEIYRRWGVPDYKHIRQDQFEAVLDFLEEWRQAVLRAGATTPPPPASNA